MKKKSLCLFLTAAMVLAMTTSSLFAVKDDAQGGLSIGANGLCEHHTEHTAACGYTAGTPEQPCSHGHTDACYAVAALCVHEHDASCGGLENPTACTHPCSEETKCATRELNCPHIHDESCGYAPATEGMPCTYVCKVCNPQDSGDPATPSDAQPEECTCETLCTGEEINADCPVCSVEGAELDKVCVDAALLLTAPTLRTGEIKLFIGGQQITESGCYENQNGTWTKVDGTEPASGQFYYDAATFTLTLNQAEITHDQTVKVAEGYTYEGSVIAFSQTADVSLKIVVSQGTSTITGTGGIRVESTTENASLSIKGSGSLDVEPKGSNSGITLCSSKNTNLDIDGADVTASSPAQYGVYLISSTDATSTSTITVNNGSLTTGGNGNVGIYYYWSGTSNAGTSSLTVSGNAVVDTRNSQIMVQDRETVVQVGAGSDGNGGIVFNGKVGTVYGDVTLQEDLTIGEGESLDIPSDASLTIPDGASLTIGSGATLTVDGGELKGNVPQSGVVYKVTEVKLDKTSLTLDVGKSDTLTATITPDNATDQNVAWSSDPSNIVTITPDTSDSKKATITATGTGTTTIKATVDGKSSTCAVTVTAKTGGSSTSPSFSISHGRADDFWMPVEKADGDGKPGDPGKLNPPMGGIPRIG